MPKIQATIPNNTDLKLLDTYINQISAIASDVLNYFRKNTASEHNNANSTSLPRFIILEEIISDIIKNNLNWQCKIEFVNTQYSWVYLIPIQLQRTLTNLLNNAYESLTNPIKHITITTSIDQQNTIVLTIEDTGCGIPPEYLAKVLCGKSLKHIGNGLGLSSAVEYFTNIGGNLAIESGATKYKCVTFCNM